jgi:hypothetical protein
VARSEAWARPVKRFAICHWTPSHDGGLVHEEDLGRLKDSDPFQRVFEVTGGASGWATIERPGMRFRVRDELLIHIQSLLFLIDQMVTVFGGLMGQICRLPTELTAQSLWRSRGRVSTAARTAGSGSTYLRRGR